MLADRLPVAVAAEIAGERLLADHVLAGLHGGDDHFGMQIGRRADVDDVKLAVCDQLGEAAIDPRDLVAMCKLDDMVAARSDRRDLDIHAVDAPERIHMQLRHEAAADESHPDPGHSAPLTHALGGTIARRRTYSTETRTTPALIMPSALAAGTERSTIRPRMKGPRSLTRH